MIRDIGIYLTQKGGVVFIYEDDGSSYCEGGKSYQAWWSQGFRYKVSILDFSCSLEGVIGFLEGWDPQIRLIEDLGEFPLFARRDGEGLAVAIKEELGCTEPILAKDVPAGTFLVGNALDFFEYWKGEGAITPDRRLKKSPTAVG